MNNYKFFKNGKAIKEKKSVISKIALLSLLTISLLLTFFFIWTSDVYSADKIALEETLGDVSVNIKDTKNCIIISPRNTLSETGFIFYPGAKVIPEAYVSKLAFLSKKGDLYVVIAKPPFNLAFFSINQAEYLKSLIPDVKKWYVGGHSLGGSMACIYASKNFNTIEGLILFGTYSGNDLSGKRIRTLSINGGRDGIFTPEFISSKKNALPQNATMIMIEGMNHSIFGTYGKQKGDFNADISDSEASLLISEIVTVFIYDDQNFKRQIL